MPSAICPQGLRSNRPKQVVRNLKLQIACPMRLACGFGKPVLGLSPKECMLPHFCPPLCCLQVQVLLATLPEAMLEARQQAPGAGPSPAAAAAAPTAAAAAAAAPSTAAADSLATIAATPSTNASPLDVFFNKLKDVHSRAKVRLIGRCEIGGKCLSRGCHSW